MRNKIEHIASLIIGFAKQFKQNNSGIITSEFTDDFELKIQVKTLYDSHENMLVQMGQTTWGGESSIVDFDSYFESAMKEFSASNTIEASSSSTLKKSKKTWLNEKKFVEFDWDKGPTESYRERYFNDSVCTNRI